MKTEIKKAILNKYFICISLFGIAIAVLHSYSVITDYISMIKELRVVTEKGQNPYAPITNAFTSWIGWDSENKFSKLLFSLFPFVSVLSYCWSYCSDKKNGKSDRLIMKIGKFNYHSSKYVAVFISSGLVITIPLLLDFLMILMFIPAIFPDSVYDIYYGIFSNNFMADIFYTQPFIYVFIFLLLNFVYCGLFGCIGYAVSTFIKSRLISVSMPVGIILITEYIKNKVISDISFQRNNFSPLTFLYPAKSINTNWFIVISEIFLIFLITFYFSSLRFLERKNTQKNNNEESL